MTTYPSNDFSWRHAVLLMLVLFPPAWLLGLDPIPQDVAYHNFADTRRFLGVPNFFDVLTSLPFLLIGAVGTKFCLTHDLGPVRSAWLALFVGIGLVGPGSAYYHCTPGNETLVWDRLPMSVAFMGLLTALLGDYVNRRLSKLLIPLIILGISSVLYWHRFDDLRPYVGVQFIPLLTLPFVMALFGTRHTYQWILMAALVLYILAKGAEVYDGAVFQMTGEVVSGHTVKHLLVSAGCYGILAMLRKRRPKV